MFKLLISFITIVALATSSMAAKKATENSTDVAKPTQPPSTGATDLPANTVANAITSPLGARSSGGDYYSYASDACSTGTVQCCDQISSPDTYGRNSVKTLFGGNMDSLNGNLGVQCTPLQAFGAGFAGNCAGQTACCQHYNSKELVGANCTPLAAQV